MKKKRNKNPNLYDFGYHITASNSLSNIKKYGLIVNKRRNEFNTKSSIKEVKNSIEISQLIYNNVIPLYFLTSTNYKYISRHLINSMIVKYGGGPVPEKDYYPILLKVNVKSFNQLPDVDFLLLNVNMQYQYVSVGENSYINFMVQYGPKGDYIPPKLQKWVKYYNWQIPILEFKHNPKLVIDVIATTHTFCVAKDIAPEYILEIEKLPELFSYK